jgi:hypothetical protein
VLSMAALVAAFGFAMSHAREHFARAAARCQPNQRAERRTAILCTWLFLFGMFICSFLPIAGRVLKAQIDARGSGVTPPSLRETLQFVGPFQTAYLLVSFGIPLAFHAISVRARTTRLRESQESALDEVRAAKRADLIVDQTITAEERDWGNARNRALDVYRVDLANAHPDPLLGMDILHDLHSRSVYGSNGFSASSEDPEGADSADGPFAAAEQTTDEPVNEQSDRPAGFEGFL